MNYQFEVVGQQQLKEHPVPGTQQYKIHAMINDSNRGNIYDFIIEIKLNEFGPSLVQTLDSLINNASIRTAFRTALNKFVEENL
jgi:hypothetical protein